MVAVDERLGGDAGGPRTSNDDLTPSPISTLSETRFRAAVSAGILGYGVFIAHYGKTYSSCDLSQVHIAAGLSRRHIATSFC